MSLTPDEVAALERLPESLQNGLRLYVEQGLVPGGFLVACIENNLLNAACRGDAGNIVALPDIMRWLYNCTPSKCWGSREKLEAWAKRGGMGGRDRG